MKQIFLLLAFMGLLLTGCAEAEQNIDKTAQEAKSLLDNLGNNAEELIGISKDKLKNSDETISKLKNVIDKVAEKTKGINQRVENDPELKNKLNDMKNTLENDATDIIKELEGIFKDLQDDKK